MIGYAPLGEFGQSGRRSLDRPDVVIKLGGSILKDDGLIQEICRDLLEIYRSGRSILIVHGGGPSINDELALRGIRWVFCEGQRVTSLEMMDVIEKVLCGQVNRKIVRGLNAAIGRGGIGFKPVGAVGIAGTDAHLLLCDRAEAGLGRVGVIRKVNVDFLKEFYTGQSDYLRIPVVAPVGVDDQGQALNVNADWAASWIAQALKVEKIIYLTDQDGILNRAGAVIDQLDDSRLDQLVCDETVSGGMKVKVRAIQAALKGHVGEVQILSALRPRSLVEVVFNRRSLGSTCRLAGF